MSDSADERLLKLMHHWQGFHWAMNTDSGVYRDLVLLVKNAEAAARAEGRREGMEACAAECERIWLEELNLTRLNKLSHGCRASATAIRALIEKEECGIAFKADPSVPPGTVEFRDASGRTLGKIVDLEKEPSDGE